MLKDTPLRLNTKKFFFQETYFMFFDEHKESWQFLTFYLATHHHWIRWFSLTLRGCIVEN